MGKPSNKNEVQEIVVDVGERHASLLPDLKRLFEEARTGRPLVYKPMQIIEEFCLYIADIRNNPIQLESRYSMQSQTRYLPRAPKISDFVVRWLGKDMSWWSRLSDEHNNKNANLYASIKEKIQTYCYEAKLNGALFGIYNHNIVARELGLVDKQQIDQKQPQIVIKVNSEEELEGIRQLGNMV